MATLQYFLFLCNKLIPFWVKKTNRELESLPFFQSMSWSVHNGPCAVFPSCVMSSSGRRGHAILSSWSRCLVVVVTLSCRGGHAILSSWSGCLVVVVTLSCRRGHVILWSRYLVVVTLSCRGHASGSPELSGPVCLFADFAITFSEEGQ